MALSEPWMRFARCMDHEVWAAQQHITQAPIFGRLGMGSSILERMVRLILLTWEGSGTRDSPFGVGSSTFPSFMKS